jgi:H+/Cl- antiporter ClcA
MDHAAAGPDPAAMMRSRRFVVLLLIAAVVGIVVSLAAWCFLELVHQIQVGLFTDLPKDLGYDHGAPLWWSLPILLVAGVVTAFAIERLPGNGGHVPALGLHAGATQPIELPGVMLAALATIGLGVVLGPEAPLIALGGGLAILLIRTVRRDAPSQVALVMAAAGTFAAVSMLFDSPLIAALLVIEATGLGGSRLPVVLLPGLLAAGIGSLVSVGMGSWTGLSTSAYALGTLTLPHYARPTAAALGWSIALAIAVTVGALAIVRIGRSVADVAKGRAFLVAPVAGLVISGLAIAFASTTDKDVMQVLFSGQDTIGPMTASPAAWSLGTLALLILFKGLAWGVSLGSFRGGPTFPALLLGAAAGMMAARLPGFALTPAVAVGMGAAIVAVLRLPMSAVALAVLLTSGSGAGAGPLVIVGVVVAYMTMLAITGRPSGEPADGPVPAAAGR